MGPTGSQCNWQQYILGILIEMCLNCQCFMWWVLQLAIWFALIPGMSLVFLSWPKLKTLLVSCIGQSARGGVSRQVQYVYVYICIYMKVTTLVQLMIRYVLPASDMSNWASHLCGKVGWHDLPHLVMNLSSQAYRSHVLWCSSRCVCFCVFAAVPSYD